MAGDEPEGLLEELGGVGVRAETMEVDLFGLNFDWV